MDKEKTIYFTEIDDPVWQNMVKRRRQEATGFWESDYSLKSVRAENNKQYLGTYIEDQLIDERYEEVYLDNRQFTSVRTIVPFLAARITAAEVVPANSNDLSLQFAADFEEVLQKHAAKQKARARVRLAVQDVLKGERVGVLKWRYDATLNTVALSHVKPSSLVIGKRSKLLEEPDYIGETLQLSIGDLCRMFPDKQAKIYELFGIQKGLPSQIEKMYDIDEDWLWVDTGDKKQLVVGWSYNNFCFGKITDPNWNENGKNIIDQPMVPYIFFNFLNDGSSLIDQTSFIEQGKWLQVNYNKRGQVIAESAKYGGTGVPIFAKGAIPQKDVAKIRFSPIQRILLDTADVGKAFTTWQAQNLPQFIVEDKYDLRNSIDNIWGTPNILRGEQSDNNTLGQDIMIRDQAEGRLSDPIDCIDESMTRFYLLEAQLMYRYFDEKKFYNYLGNDGKFVSIAISQEDIAKNIGIQIDVKAGTSLPIDRAQRRATIMKLLEINRVGTLTAYKELGVFEDPEAAYKEFMLEQADPAASLEDVDKQVFNREANEDLQLVIANKQPEEREDLEDEYIAYLTEWLLKDKYKLLQEKNPEAANRVSSFVDSVIEKASRKADKLAMQPAPETGMVPPEMAGLMGGEEAAPGQPPIPAVPEMAGVPPGGQVV